MTGLHSSSFNSQSELSEAVSPITRVSLATARFSAKPSSAGESSSPSSMRSRTSRTGSPVRNRPCAFRLGMMTDIAQTCFTRLAKPTLLTRPRSSSLARRSRSVFVFSLVNERSDESSGPAQLREQAQPGAPGQSVFVGAQSWSHSAETSASSYRRRLISLRSPTPSSRSTVRRLKVFSMNSVSSSKRTLPRRPRSRR